jgi:sirohydrochlorin ferrochelatase
VADLERRLAGGAADVPEPDGAGDGGADPEVVRLLREGKDVQATALVHKQRGSSLAEAKAEVDRLRAQLSL